MLQSPAPSPAILREPVSRMHLVFDEEDDEGQEGERSTEGGKDPQAPVNTGPQEPTGKSAPQDSGWDAGGSPRIVCNNTSGEREREKEKEEEINFSHILSVRLCEIFF